MCSPIDFKAVAERIGRQENILILYRQNPVFAMHPLAISQDNSHTISKIKPEINVIDRTIGSATASSITKMTGD